MERSAADIAAALPPLRVAALQYFCTDDVRTRLGESSTAARRRDEERRRLREIVPSSAWYVDVAEADENRPQSFPVPGMVESDSRTPYEHDDDGRRHARASRRYFPAQSVVYEDGLDGMTAKRAAYYYAPPAWSGELIAQTRPFYEAEEEWGDDRTTLRVTYLGEYQPRRKPQHADRADRFHAWASWPQLQDTAPRPGTEGPTWRCRFRATGRRRWSDESLTWPWATGEVEVLEDDFR